MIERTAAGSAPSLAEEHRRILIVEDNPDAAAMMRDFLELAGHEVELASTGNDGVQAARQFHPEVVLCDLGLPGMNGFEVAAQLRRDPETAAAKLIAITGYGREEDRRRSRRVGGDGRRQALHGPLVAAYAVQGDPLAQLHQLLMSVHDDPPLCSR